jgi:iron-sulfur cluster assembly protein
VSIEFTEKAAIEAKTILFEHRADCVSALRIGIQSGGCNGFTYTVDLCYTPDENDKVFVSHDVKLVCDPQSYLYLAGTVIDFNFDLVNRGFVFNNPNAKNICSCGASFSI